MRRTRRRLVHYGAAALGVAVAALLRWVLVETFGPGVPPFITFFGAVALAAALGGLGPGVLALLTSVAIIALFFFAPPVLPGDVAGLAVFTATGVLLAVLGGRLRQARLREHERAVATEEALRVLDLAPVCVLDPALRITRWRAGCERLYGFPAEQALGRAIHELLGTRFPEPVERVRAALFAAGRWHGVLHQTAADGRPLVVSVDCVVVRDAAGAPAAVVESATDVTAQVESEAELRESERRYRTLFDSIDEGFCVIEVLFDGGGKPVDYRFLELSPSFERQTGLVGARGKRIRELVPAHEERWFETYGRIARTGEPARFEQRAAQLDRWYDVFAVRYGEPERRQVAVLFNDITERHTAVQALRTRTAAMDATADMVVVTDADGTIQYVNPAFTATTGYEAAEAIGQNPRMLKSDRQPPGFYEELWRTIRGGAVWRGELVNRRKDGSTYAEEMTITAVTGANGTITNFVAIKRDVTERKRAEAALVELKDSLERRVAERTSEIRTLAGELLRAEQLERARLATVLHDGLQQLLVAAKVQLGILRRRASPEALTTADQLIDQSIEASRTLTVELSPPILRQRGLAAGLEWLGRWMADKHGLTVRVAVGDGGPEADPELRTFLFEAAREALLNVVKHAGTDAAVVSLDRTGDCLRTRVEDRGKGFDPALRAAEDRQLGGTGLLGIRQRAELLGGRLEVTSTPGQGTCVALEVPLRAGGRPPESGCPPQVTAGSPEGSSGG